MSECTLVSSVLWHFLMVYSPLIDSLIRKVCVRLWVGVFNNEKICFVTLVGECVFAFLINLDCVILLHLCPRFFNQALTAYSCTCCFSNMRATLISVSFFPVLLHVAVMLPRATPWTHPAASCWILSPAVSYPTVRLLPIPWISPFLSQCKYNILAEVLFQRTLELFTYLFK